MGLLKRLKGMTPEKKERLYSGLLLLGGLLGRGDKALALVSLLDSVPGRVQALERAKAAIDNAADEQEAKEESGTTLEPGADSGLRLTNEELAAMDDWLDLQSRGSRSLKRLARKLF